MVMQREEFSERAQTQKMDTNQGERARLENRRRFSGELAEGALQFFALEQTLGGQAGGFGAWLQATYELNEDFEEPYSKVVDDICQAFREVERRHGTAIAQHLYDVHSVILPTEIQNAADYLALGGQPEDLPALARSGIFLEHLDPDAITRAIDYMESAGEASGAYQAAKVETQDKTWDSGQKFQQIMGR